MNFIWKNFYNLIIGFLCFIVLPFMTPDTRIKLYPEKVEASSGKTIIRKEKK